MVGLPLKVDEQSESNEMVVERNINSKYMVRGRA